MTTKGPTSRSATRVRRRRQVVQQVRQAVWQMRNPNDMQQVLLAVRSGLEALEIAFEVCEINLFDLYTDPPSLRSHTLDATPSGPTRGDGAEREILLRIWRSGWPAYRPDLEAVDIYHERDLINDKWGARVRTVLDVPFSHGTLALNSCQPHAFSTAEIAVVGEFAQILSEGSRRLEDLQALERRAIEAEALAAAILAVANSTEIDEVLEAVAQQARRVVGAVRATIFLYDEVEGCLVPCAQVGHQWEVYRQLRLRPGEAASGRVFTSGTPVFCGPGLGFDEEGLRPENLALLEASTSHIRRAGVVVPLKLGDRPVGTLAVSTPRPCTQRDLFMVEQLAAQATLAIQRTRHLAALEAEVAERKHTEERLAQSESALRKAQRLARVGSWVWHIQGDRLEWSDEMYRIFGIEKEHFTGRQGEVVAQRIHPDDRGAVERMNRQIAKGEAPTPMEYRVIWPDQTVHTIWAEAGELTLDQAGHPAVLTGIVQDISERKRAEEALREKDARYRAIVERAMDGFWIVDTQGRLLEVNEAYCRMSGYRQEELLALGIDDLDLIETAAQVAARIQRIRQEGEDRFESRHRRKDGSAFEVEVSVQYLPIENGRLVCFLRDITERRQREEEVRTLSQSLVQASEEERRILARELHDETGQALTALKINLEALRQSPSSERLEESVVITAELLQQVRDFSLDLRPSLLDDFGLAAALRGYLERRAKQAGLGLEIQFETLVPRAPVSVETACFRIAQQAMTNTIRHAQARAVVAALRRQGEVLHLSLRDDGAGFSVQEALHRAASGESVGLLSMQERARLVGGRVEVTSALGRGTVVQAAFPLRADI